MQLLLLAVWLFAHPYFLSVTELKHNTHDRAIEGSVKLFVHDFESTLRKSGHQGIDLMHMKDRAATEKIVAGYVQEHLHLWINGVEKKVEVIGTEQEAENFWVHLSFKDCASIGEVKFENTLLYEYLKDQVNIVHLQANGTTKSYRLVNPEKTISFDFRR